MMNESTARNLTRFKYAATLLGAMAVFALAPATAYAQPVNNGAGDGGCHYTDKDGYDIPIDDGQSVLVDGKTVSCSGGTITVSLKTSGAGAQQQQGNPVLSPVTKTPKRPLQNQNVAVFVQQR
ncbi:MAG: hypothetical protein QOI01_2936 [Mycobacterium sp.]|jgi:hypothetical protein|nr:hypothetical protein [Mycobacterium sp.]